MWQAIDRGYHLCSGLQVLLLLQPDLSIYRNNEMKLEYPSYGNVSLLIFKNYYKEISAFCFFLFLIFYREMLNKSIDK